MRVRGSRFAPQCFLSAGPHRSPIEQVEARWRLTWALDSSERPPPSSIAGRLDTEETLVLARVLDRDLLVTAEIASNQVGISDSWKSGATGMITVFLGAKPQADIARIGGVRNG